MTLTSVAAFDEFPATPAQIEAVAELIWTEPPESLDVRFLHTVDQPKVSENEAREGVIGTYLEIAARDGWSESETAQRIDAETARILEENKHPRIFHTRLRTQRHKSREDVRCGQMGMPPDLESGWAETFTNLGDRAKGDHTNWHYHLDNEGASIRDTGYWGTSGVSRFGRIPEEIATMLWFATGDPTGRKVSFGLPMRLNQQKLEHLISGFSRDVAILCEEDESQTIYSIRLPESANALFGKLWIRKELSIVTKWELYLPTTGQLVRREYGNGFFENGFPKEWNKEMYPVDGEPMYESFTFFEVDLDARVPDEVFVYNPPKSWGSTDFRGGREVTTVNGKTIGEPRTTPAARLLIPRSYRLPLILFGNLFAFGCLALLWLRRRRSQQ